jgi:hypothetical protein
MITIDIDGPDVTVTGTTKGDDVQRRALDGTAFRWSSRAGAWVLPRNLRTPTRDANIARFRAALERAGVAVAVEDSGRTQSVAEAREAQRERLEARQERHEQVAERASAASDGAWERSRQIASFIPLGQPVLVGHHSERRHRRDIERMDRLDRKAIEDGKAAEQAARLAEGLRARLTNGDSVGTIRRRLDRLRAELRGVERSLDGTGRATMHTTPTAATGEHRERLLARQAALAEEIGLDEQALAQAAASGTRIWTRDDFIKGDEVFSVGQWLPVVKVNARSVTVPHPFMTGETATRPYDKITGRRRDGVVEK